MKLQIVCAGIGGRGVLLASTILIEVAVKAGLKAMASDEYGMSQRGGSVVSLVKVGDFASPLVGRESADILLAFEESEVYRNLMFLKSGGITLVNSVKKSLSPNIESLLRQRDIKSHLLDADAIAMERGMMQASNMAMLGFFSTLEIEPYSFEKIAGTIREKVKAKLVEKNFEVFMAGRERAQSSQLQADSKSL
jgi:indolepyruvate ferredoxin oxidoreductase beta subunit